MPLVVKDRVLETSTTTGTGSFTLSGAAVGYQTFSSAIGNTNTTYYTIDGGAEWEVGLGTVSAGALARTTVLASSNSGALVNFSAGAKNVFCTYPADKAVELDANNVLTDVAITVKDNVFTLQDDVDPTKQARFQLSSIATGTTRTFSFINADGVIPTTASSNTWTGTNTFTGSTVSVGTAVGTSTYSFGTGATQSGITKTITLGGSGASGSTTNIAIGSAVGGATTNVNAYGTWTYTNTISASISGNAATVTNGLYTTNLGVTVQAYDVDTTKNDVANTFTANQIISVTDNTNAALRVTQLGTGNAILVEDETNPDSTPFVVTATGSVGIGTSTPTTKLSVYDNTAPAVVSAIGDGVGANFRAIRYSTDATGPANGFFKYRGSFASPTAVASGDSMGALSFNAYGGTNTRLIAAIAAVVDSYVSDTDISSVLTFSTSPAGGTTLTEGMRLNASGDLGIGTTNPAFKLDINGSGAVRGSSGFNFYNSDNSNFYYILNSGATGSSNGVLTFTQGGVAERMRLDASGNLLFNSGYGSVATAYGCRAWVNFNGTGTVAIRGSGNVSSITDGGTGTYTVNFTTSMPDANYSAVVTGSDNASTNARYINDLSTSTSSVFFELRNVQQAAQDANYVLVAVFR